MEGLLRIFIAVELSPAIREWLVVMKAGLLPRIPSGSVRWTDPNGIHLTLKFLGEVPSRRIGEIRSILDGLAPSFHPFALSAAGLGCFPDTARPRVIWAGVRADPRLADLQKRMDADLEKIGFPPERRAFSPHLTLGRVKDGIAGTRLEEVGRAVEAVSVESSAGMVVKDVCLFRSVLQPGGPVYTVLHRAPLSG